MLRFSSSSVILFIPFLSSILCHNTPCCSLRMKEELWPQKKVVVTEGTEFSGRSETTRVWVKAAYFTNSSRKWTSRLPKAKRQWRRVKQTDNLCPTTWRLSRTRLFPHKWLIKPEKNNSFVSQKLLVLVVGSRAHEKTRKEKKSWS